LLLKALMWEQQLGQLGLTMVIWSVPGSVASLEMPSSHRHCKRKFLHSIFSRSGIHCLDNGCLRYNSPLRLSMKSHKIYCYLDLLSLQVPLLATVLVHLVCLISLSSQVNDNLSLHGMFDLQDTHHFHLMDNLTQWSIRPTPFPS